MLGLADEVGGDVLGVGGRVGEHGDLGRTRLCVDADESLEQPLGGGDVDVARTGHETHRGTLAVLTGRVVDETVREAGHGLCTTHGPDLVDAEQGARREDRRVRVPCEDALVVALRWAGHGEGTDPGDLGGHDIHHHGARVDRAPTRDVETDPLDGHPALGDGAALVQAGGGVGAPLVGVHGPGALDRDLERAAHVGVEHLDGGIEHLGRDAEGGRPDPVEALSELVQRRRAAVMDVVADRADRLECGLDVVLRARQGSAQRPGPEGLGAQVDRGEHGSSLDSPHGAADRCLTAADRYCSP